MRRRFAIQLSLAVVLAFPVGAVESKQAVFLGSYAWRESAGWFGGFSAIHMSADGGQMIAVSDRSNVVTARIERRGDQIADIAVQSRSPLLSSRGHKLSGRAGDSEGIAVTAEGGFFLSFEGVHRVAYYASPKSPARVLPRPTVFQKLERNGSFEALAMDDRGRLYTLTEKSRTAAGDIPVYRWDGGGWSTPFVLQQRGSFLPVAADFGPDGRFYVLERSVSMFGFRSRLRRWQLGQAGPSAEETLLETASGTHDNLEGVSVWRDTQGHLRATMISDDNFLALQKTELVEYLLPD